MSDTQLAEQLVREFLIHVKDAGISGHISSRCGICGGRQRHDWDCLINRARAFVDGEPQPKAPPGKGEFKGECNRTACHTRPAIYYNYPMQKFYCEDCAELIQSQAGDLRIFDINKTSGKVQATFEANDN